ncbi:phage tail protein [Ensifer sp. MPMI2T]|nr:phage tail protein [Ensifer sp. MPMI2T]
MLMGWGPFRFTVPNYSVETIRRSLQARVEPQPVIGAKPTLHRLGPNNETISLESTFFPYHFNGRGLAQLAGVRQAVNAVTPLMLVHMNGSLHNVFGRWVATSVDDEQTFFNAFGAAERVSVTLSLMQDDRLSSRSIALESVLSAVNFGLSVRLGF